MFNRVGRCLLTGVGVSGKRARQVEDGAYGFGLANGNREEGRVLEDGSTTSSSLVFVVSPIVVDVFDGDGEVSRGDVLTFVFRHHRACNEDDELPVMRRTTCIDAVRFTIDRPFGEEGAVGRNLEGLKDRPLQWNERVADLKIPGLPSEIYRIAKIAVFSGHLQHDVALLDSLNDFSREGALLEARLLVVHVDYRHSQFN